MLASIICWGGGSSSMPVRPAASSTLRSASATSGGASVPDCARVRWAPSAASDSAAVLHCMTVGMISSNVMSG